jgi:hypothetical protein
MSLYLVILFKELYMFRAFLTHPHEFLHCMVSLVYGKLLYKVLYINIYKFLYDVASSWIPVYIIHEGNSENKVPYFIATK